MTNNLAKLDNQSIMDILQSFTGIGSPARRWEKAGKLRVYFNVDCDSVYYDLIRRCWGGEIDCGVDIMCYAEKIATEIVEKIEAENKLKLENNPLCNMPVKITPYKHQQDAYIYTLQQFGLLPSVTTSPGVALLMEMGTGKTLTAIAATGALYNKNKIKRVLIVAPLSILTVWRDEFDKFADFGYDLRILKGTMDAKKKNLAKATEDGLQIVVANYESAWRLEAEIAEWQPELIICDEGHKLKNIKTNVSVAMHRLGGAAKYRLLLTGTPITNHAQDIFSQYTFLNTSVFGDNYYGFLNRYFIKDFYTYYFDDKMKYEFKNKIHSIAFEASKADCLDLPAITEIVRTVELEPAAARTYQKLHDNAMADVTINNVLTKILRLSQATGGFLTDDDGNVTTCSKAKMDVLQDIIDGTEAEGKKIVVIARFVAEINAICQMLEKMNIKYSKIMGETKNRDEEVKKFQDDPEVTVFVGQIATAGMGITLTAASTMVFYSMDYAMSNFEQCKARIHRSGQKMPCTYIYLVAENTIDNDVLWSLREKKSLAERLVKNYQKPKKAA